MIALGALLLVAAIGNQGPGLGHSALEEQARATRRLALHEQAPDVGQCLVPGAQCLVPTWVFLQEVTPEVIAEIRVHGNVIVANDEVVKIAGIAIGDAFGPTTIADVTARLRESKKFQHIEVLKRFASIADPTKIVIVIVVNEGAVRIDVPDDRSGQVSVVKRRGLRNLMIMPILDGEDGYGITFGARLAFVNMAGRKNRLSFPLTWGGMKQAGAEYEQPLAKGLISRVLFGGAVQRQKNPAFEIEDVRQRTWGRAERVIGHFRLGGDLGWQHVSFGGTTDNLRTFGGDVTFDTRIDPILPRNAVYALASVEHVDFDARPDAIRTRLEGRGYLGLIRQNVLALRVVREDASEPLPAYLKSLLGGWSTLRGFKAGAFVGDTVVSGSAELRVPLSSSLEIGKIGVSVFVDTGTAYNHGERYHDQSLHTGIGGSVWLAAAIFHMDVSVAHGRGADTRVNFGIGVTF